MQIRWLLAQAPIVSAILLLQPKVCDYSNAKQTSERFLESQATPYCLTTERVL